MVETATMEKTNTTFKVVYTVNGKTLEISDLLNRHVNDKDINISAWKAIQFFDATKTERANS